MELMTPWQNMIDKDMAYDESDCEEDDEPVSDKVVFVKPRSMISNWASQVTPKAEPQEDLSQLPQYEAFIKHSEAYKWLVSKIGQHDKLMFGDTNIMSEIGSKILSAFREQKLLTRMSRSRPSLVKMTFVIDWNIMDFIHCLPHPGADFLGKILCLTGTWDEAQTATVSEYVRQTWPVTGEHILSLLDEIFSCRGLQDYMCKYRCHYFVFITDISVQTSFQGKRVGKYTFAFQHHPLFPYLLLVVQTL